MNNPVITLEDLSPRQCALADILWACDTQDACERFVQGLPTKSLQQEAQTVLELMRLAVLDQQA